MGRERARVAIGEPKDQEDRIIGNRDLSTFFGVGDQLERSMCIADGHFFGESGRSHSVDDVVIMLSQGSEVNLNIVKQRVEFYGSVAVFTKRSNVGKRADKLRFCVEMISIRIK